MYSSVMSTVAATFPDDLQLQDREEFDLHVVAKDGGIMVTHILHREPPKKSVSKAARPKFSERWRGKFSVVSDPNDPVIARLNARHVK